MLTFLRRRLICCRRISVKYWCYRRPIVSLSVLAVIIIGLQILFITTLNTESQSAAVNKVMKVAQAMPKKSPANRKFTAGKVVGVPSNLQAKYQPNDNGLFSCINSDEKIDYSRVNDDFCDCEDGSDEPSTNACSEGKFYCDDKVAIPSSRVNDGICDCCNGIDEFRNISVITGVDKVRQERIGHYLTPCSNRC